MKKNLKRFIVRKFIMASSAHEALKREPKFKADEVYLDDTWIQKNEVESDPIKGFGSKIKLHVPR